MKATEDQPPTGRSCLCQDGVNSMSACASTDFLTLPAGDDGLFDALRMDDHPPVLRRFSRPIQSVRSSPHHWTHAADSAARLVGDGIPHG